LVERGVLPCLLDGDVLRRALAPTLGYRDDARTAFYDSLGALAALLAGQGLVVLVAATAHRRSYRRHARGLAPRFIEVWVTTSLDECRRRDAKGSYASAAPGGSVPGLDVPYEPPEQAELKAEGGRDTWAIEQVLALLSPELSAAHEALEA
jgi:adenylylsulfate kinase